MNNRYRFSSLLLILLWLVLGLGREQGTVVPITAAMAEEKSAPVVLAPFVPSPIRVVVAMLQLAGVTEKDVVYDLGSGDGRVVITAAKKYGARAVGFEIDPDLVKKARERARKEQVEHLVEIRQQDAMTADVSEATVVTLYLFPKANLLLKPLLQRQLRPGARVVSSQFDMGDWRPAASRNLTLVANKESTKADGTPAWGDMIPRYYTIYLWRIDNHR